MQKPFRIVGTGQALPSKVLTNLDLEAMVDTSDEWIRERTGIRERRIAAEGEATSHLAARAVEQACERAGLATKDLDVIIVGTSTPDTLFPSTACWVQERLGLGGATAFDVSAGCSGWMYGMQLAADMVGGGTARRVAVVGAEVMSRVLNWKDRRTCVLFGDGAGAAIVEADPSGESGMLSSNWGADGTLAKLLYQPAGGSQRPADANTVAESLHTVHMDGGAVFKHAVRAMADSANAALAAAECTAEDVDLFVPHQANQRIMEATRTRVGIPTERVFSVLEKCGNMSAATIPVALAEAESQGRLKRGDRILTSAFGTGFTWAASLLRW